MYNYHYNKLLFSGKQKNLQISIIFQKQ